MNEEQKAVAILRRIEPCCYEDPILREHSHRNLLFEITASFRPLFEGRQFDVNDQRLLAEAVNEGTGGTNVFSSAAYFNRECDVGSMKKDLERLYTMASSGCSMDQVKKEIQRMIDGADEILRGYENDSDD